MDGRLFAGALAKFAAGVVAIGLLLFLPAGTLNWWQGWLFMGILFVPMFVAGFVMMAKAPDLLRKRLDAKEDETEQKAVLALSALMFVAAFVVAGLGFRGIVGGRRRVLGRIRALCRGHARERLPLAHH